MIQELTQLKDLRLPYVARRTTFISTAAAREIERVLTNTAITYPF